MDDISPLFNLLIEVYGFIYNELSMAKYIKKYILWHQDQVFYLELSLCISQEFTEHIPRPNTLKMSYT